jgi:hypothetical protein
MQRISISFTFIALVFIFSPAWNPVAASAICKADYDANNKVEAADLTVFASNYKKTGISCSLDLAGDDCYLDVKDLSYFASQYNNTALNCAGTTQSGIWISPAEIQALPTTGTAWQNVLEDANESISGASLADQDDPSNAYTYAKALAYARTGEQKYLTGVLEALRIITYNNTESQSGGRTLSVGRELGAYVIAADIINLKSVDATLDTAFRAKIRSLLTKEMDGRNGIDTLWDSAMKDPSNWGNHARASVIAVVSYLGDTAKLDQVANRFQDWTGRATSELDFNELWWHCNQTSPRGINPDCLINGHSVGGALPDDHRRCGTGFSWPPCKTSYQWEALQGTFASAEMLYRAGYDSYGWSDKALLRAIKYLYETTFSDGTSYPAESDDRWIVWIVNKRYGTTYALSTGVNPGKNIGYTDWTHAK